MIRLIHEPVTVSSDVSSNLFNNEQPKVFSSTATTFVVIIISIRLFAIGMYDPHYPTGRGRRVVGSIRDVGAGNPGSLPVRNANSGIPLKVD